MTENTAELATSIIMAWIANAHSRPDASSAADLLAAVHSALTSIDAPPSTPSTPESEFTPAVSVRRSLASRDHIVSMLDGKPYRTLTRHISSNGLTPHEYRSRFGLPASYPMTAPGYSEARSALAKSLGLGRKAGKRVAKGDVAAEKPKPRRKTAAEAKAAAKRHLGS